MNAEHIRTDIRRKNSVGFNLFRNLLLRQNAIKLMSRFNLFFG